MITNSKSLRDAGKAGARGADYAGIDCFRVVAALLVVAIHTSPLASFTQIGDFVLTRVLARVAVPFFMMTSGFFLITRFSENASRLTAFLKKTALIYGAAMILYLPLNIYSGNYDTAYFLPQQIKDILFDGTFYHLWYLPASMLGAVIGWHLVRRLGYRGALAASGALYLIGLFGDSYYGVAVKIPGVGAFYEALFQVSDYTRNGIFFAPVFFVLGGYLAVGREDRPHRGSARRLAASALLMLAEAMLLRHFALQRHDSMYLFLIPCMYDLFSLLLRVRGRRVALIRTSALVIYLIHPAVIVAVRLAAKLISRTELFVGNSALHFAVVSLVSVLCGFAAAAACDAYQKKSGEGRRGRRAFCPETARAWIEIDGENLSHNVGVLNKSMPPKCRLMAVVKANAYGHGLFPISTRLSELGVRAFAVATLDEGIRLRKYGISGDILVLGYTDPQRARELRKYGLMQTLVSFEYAAALNSMGVPVRAHLKIDTGMHRLGLSHEDAAAAKCIFAMKNISVCGIFTHLSCSDSLHPDDARFTVSQISRFYRLIDELEAAGITIPKLHIQSSYGFLNYPELRCDYVRAGIALYGVSSTPSLHTRLKPDLRPVLSVHARVILIRTVSAGEAVGYNRDFTAERDTRIAILPIGYGDGIPRSLSGNLGSVIIRHHQFPIIGRICMDHIAVDVTDSDSIRVGDIAVVIGTDGEEDLSAPVSADLCGSISNELLARLGTRLPIILK